MVFNRGEEAKETIAPFVIHITEIYDNGDGVEPRDKLNRFQRHIFGMVSAFRPIGNAPVKADYGDPARILNIVVFYLVVFCGKTKRLS